MPFHTFRRFAAAAAMLSAAIPFQASALPQAFTVTSNGKAFPQGVSVPFVTLAEKGTTLPIIVDDADYECVKKAAAMFCADLKAIKTPPCSGTRSNQIRRTSSSLARSGTAR